MATENIRLLACSVCKTIEEIPDYEGRPEGDHLLTKSLEKHGPRENRHFGQLFKVSKEQWDNPNLKQEVAKQIANKLTAGEGEGLGSEFYEIKDQFSEDAMTCWAQHNRTKSCGDYKSDKKRLTPDTADERRQAGLPQLGREKDIFLCQFCPVHSLVVTAARRAAGMY